MDIITQLAATAEQIEADWSREFFGLDQDQRFAMLIVVIVLATGLIISLVAIFSGLVASIHRRREEGQLKRELMERGMSAEEIARIVEATPPRGWLERQAVWRRNK